MTIHGKKIGFALTVGASIALARLCPDGDISRLAENFSSDYGKTMEFNVEFLLIMSAGFCDAELLEGRDADVLTKAEIYAMKPDQLNDLMLEAMKEFHGKGEVEIESKNAEKGAPEI